LYEIGKASGAEKQETTEASTRITHHLPETESALREAIASLSLRNGHVLFFDGIDYRFMKPIKDHFPRDYQRIIEWFPLAELEIKRREFAARRKTA